MGTEYQLRRDIDRMYGLVYDLQNNEPNVFTKQEVLDKLANYIDESQIQSYLDNFLNTIYPLGAVYVTLAEDDPSDHFGGVWEMFKQEENMKYWVRNE